MTSITMWHNPRCSTSRATLQLLRDRGIHPKIRLYLENAPDPAELKAAARKLKLRPKDFIRTKEPEYKTLNLGPDATDDDLIAAMAAFPKLIERPIVFAGRRAALGRPPENVLRLLPKATG